MKARGFPPFGKGVRRARSWWGRTWLQALEDTSLDQTPLRQGRKYATAGLVGTITVSPGRISAPVHDTDDTYQTTVRLAEFTDRQWTRFLAAAAAKAGHLAALLDGEMPRDLADAAADAGVDLLPGIGDLDFECTCPDWELPCRHGAALCHQASWLLDTDPWLLLLLRGRTQEEVVTDARPTPGVLATAAYAADPVPLPPDPPVEDLGALPDFPPTEDFDAEVLSLLVAAAATRARDLLHPGPHPHLTDREDHVRLAATHPTLATRLHADPREVAAWHQAGHLGLSVLDDTRTPPKPDLNRAHTTWTDAELPPAKTWRNRWTVHTGQLRYGPDHRWYPYRKHNGTWWPTGTPNRDPAAALSELPRGVSPGTAGRTRP
ncbi:SWIM zinc finger family protein [Saccharothrix variisporea]|uniref:Putative Zn finger protein n=1 Tax=Saccharothrix variisporea TaxID=543527 RepID=A0A495X0F9_9PSEU|nr:SWF/SNF family helicase [Saccharothrix variisporea]RKT67442.1 putative Zn finger protein [Saccharothrix variisporea]